MRRGRTQRLLVFLLSIVAVLPLHAGIAFADVNDFTVTNFSADYYLSNSDKQGTLRVVEHIDLTYTDNNHGILRALPNKYKNQSLDARVTKVTSPSGAPSSYTTYTSNDNLVVKIGDSAKTVTGPQRYIIEYTEHNVVSFYKDHDELYWDINGDQWKQPFNIVDATFHLPPSAQPVGVAKPALAPRCYTGVFGSKAQDCIIQNNGQIVTVRTQRRLQPAENLSVVLAFDKGYYAAPTWRDWLAQYWLVVAQALVLPIIVGVFVLRRWLKNGKDLKGRGTIIPEYAPPVGLTPAEAGTVLNYKLPLRALSATIIDLAIRKYLRIEETTEVRRLARDKLTYQFVQLTNDYTGLTSHEVAILNGLFGASALGTPAALKDLTAFYRVSTELGSSIPQKLSGPDGYFVSNPRKASTPYVIAGVALLFFGFVFGRFIAIGATPAAILLVVFGLLMPKRTAKGVAAVDDLKGLKLYLETAEKDRIAMLQSPTSPYGIQSAEPVKTVELYEKLLPYAILLGVETQWSKQFESIYVTPPDWYSGNWSTFNTAYLATHLASSVSAMGSSFSPPSSSSGSGMSGGGFSGGGGGGGGGGGW